MGSVTLTPGHVAGSTGPDSHSAFTHSEGLDAHSPSHSGTALHMEVPRGWPSTFYGNPREFGKGPVLCRGYTDSLQLGHSFLSAFTLNACCWPSSWVKDSGSLYAGHVFTLTCSWTLEPGRCGPSTVLIHPRVHAHPANVEWVEWVPLTS